MLPPSVQTGRYVLLERIGMGGMAEVFRAASVGVEGFERPVAIKRILPHLAADEEFVKMFVDEAKIAVQLQHPNIVEIFDLAREGDDLFIAMEYVHGKDLRAILDRIQGPSDGRGARIPVEIAVHVTARICDALHHAHFAQGPSGRPLGIIHRDVSPQNVIVSYDGEVKVTDFGLAKAAGRAVQTQAGVVKGKLAYMSPEQLRGQPIDQRSDVYGVGILLWEMLTGMRLFLGKNDQETLRRVYHAQVPRPRSIRPELHPDLEDIVMKALEKDVERRYETAELMQEDLTAWMYAAGTPVGTPGVAALMRRVYPQAEPTSAPSSHPPTTRPNRIGAVGATPTHRPRGRRAFESHPPPALAAQPAQTQERGPISLDDLEDLVEEPPEAPRDRVTRAVRSNPSGPAQEGSDLVRTVVHRAIASSSAQTHPPPSRAAGVVSYGPHDVGRAHAGGPAPVEPDREPITEVPRHRASRGSLPERSSGALSAPRVPSIQDLIEEALASPEVVAPSPYAPEQHDTNETHASEWATHPFGQAFVPWADEAPAAPTRELAEPAEPDDFDDHTTLVGSERELAEAEPGVDWGLDSTSLHDPRRQR